MTRNQLAEQQRLEAHQKYMKNTFGLNPGDEYQRTEFDQDGNPIILVYVVGQPYTPIRRSA
jgi:hypothetical protein